MNQDSTEAVREERERNYFYPESESKICPKMSGNWSDIESERDDDCPLEGQSIGYPSDHQADCQLSMEFHQRCQMEKQQQ